VKVLLAQEIVARFHNQAAAEFALEAFNHRAQGGVPDDIESVTVAIPADGLPLGALLKAAGMVNTSSDGVRTIEQGGCKIDGEVVKDKQTRLAVGEYVIQVGKRKFAKVGVVLS
jgi:tyrosyl-tRNA synthetase